LEEAEGRLGEIHISTALPGASLVPEVERESSGPRSGHGLQNASCMCAFVIVKKSAAAHTLVIISLLLQRCCCGVVVVVVIFVIVVV
jgi:hypothetical protein